MANPQGLPNKGTLIPGQTIAVNKYNVQVERYLSQGGFAHVYLVRTATPVYNTTHHVLKRIAVANDSMLSEVKKEVDIMRLLKGHPNIVHLIDAAWHKMSDGMYEVFILMEFCPGGGIIDMMNRRLRERLTEAEILQIFVDVCEGVACMHNLRPALLHRDLKVENILQSSPNSFKLCDFGSATNVGRPPMNTQEIRALEADLNRHTTLQYRAPEMVDPYLRRPVDEKSDVWALGVLLYKLCYYTTPFEEHGPLAILNVQYRIPPYPVYSVQMNTLIASMLKEHGNQRPTVFELLALVHRLRGTQSLFQYTIPVAPIPIISPRKPTLQPRTRSPAANPLDNTITYRTAHQMSPSPKPTYAPPVTANPGIQARDKVLDAIAPMRRGRQKPNSSRSVSPKKDENKSTTRNWMDNDFAADEEAAWKSATVKSGLSQQQPKAGAQDAWKITSPKITQGQPGSSGFGDNFAEKLWDSFDPSTSVPSTSTQPSRVPVAVSRGKDAFDGLGFGLSADKAPTLGETRKLRTGLAMMNVTPEPRFGKYDSNMNNSGISPRPSPSPRPAYLSPSQSQPISAPPVPSSTGSPSSSWKPPAAISSQPRSNTHNEGMSAETRFPSLEELDATFGVPGQSAPTQSSERPPELPSRSQAIANSNTLRPITTMQQPTNSFDGTRSQQVTGTAMRENGANKHAERQPTKDAISSPIRPGLTRKHRSSVSIKRSSQLGDSVLGSSAGRSPTTHQKPTDWLTGEDDQNSQLSPPASSTIRPIVRASPSKRASYIEQQNVSAHEATVTQYDRTPSPSRRGPSTARATITRTPSLSMQKATRVFPPVKINATSSEGLSDWNNLKRPSPKDMESSSSTDEGPEDVRGYASNAKKPQRKGRQSSVHDLVDLWGGSAPKDALDLTPQPTSKRNHGLPPISTPMNPRSVSPQPTMLSPPYNSQQTSSRSPKSDSKPPLSPSSGPTPSPRSRPQSMFIFPSKSSGDGYSGMTSPGLSAPDHPTPRSNTRRTSISDMVQKFEAIGTNPVKSPGMAPAAVIVKPTPMKSTDHHNKFSRSVAADKNINTSRPKDWSLSLPETNNTSPTTTRRSPTGAVHAPLPEETPSSSSRYVFPSRKMSATPVGGDNRSPSPERPYEGVGKLIDQWQRKTVDSDSSRPGPRGFVAKRTGMVSGGTSRS